MVFIPGSYPRTKAATGRIVKALEDKLLEFPGERDLANGERWLWGFHLNGPPRAPCARPLEAGRPAAGARRWSAGPAGLGGGDEFAVADGLVGDGELKHAVEDQPAAA
jgi:hypothetical protein